MTNHDKDDYKGPGLIRLRKEVPKPWELEQERRRLNMLMFQEEETKTETISVPSRMDA